ncbi:coil domain-containing protein 25 [Seminavis robusta]|uniref:Coil domain-containing protein 25 n=1 Tax=Seminavis robusta TaxID=568900 RepID=A0A9N8HCS2_9STRA|nr:coil domain-containing protein 25 [Seminavis robusta]|eukprot:Sro314_g115120.1 coil domain-containing protein 25 (215) ;mRNA; f:48310-49065
MVFYFKSLDGEFSYYMGKDKYENEDLIKYGLPEDVWFHVDDLSSAHVYLRMKPGMTLNDIPEPILLECSSLVKANSIVGCKKSSVYVVYTRWKNLKKTASMVDGQVGFHRPENVRRMQVEKNNPIVRQIEKTRVEEYPDLFQQQQQREKEIQRQKKEQHKLDLKAKQAAAAQARQEKEARSYDRIMTTDNMTSNTELKASADTSAAEEFEDDFF